MENKTGLGLKEKVGYGLGAVGKDMVYMLSATYVLYYFQDLLGVSAAAMGIILLAARIFDAFNDPIMGVITAKTKTKWGKFRPWLLIGTLTNAVILYMMFAAPPALDGAGLVAYAAVTYILWGVTYTMMDIPYWSMIPALTKGGKDRESLTTLARSCAGVGDALISIITMLTVRFLGTKFAASGAGPQQIERIGFKWFTLIVAVLFVVFTVILCIVIKEDSTEDMKSASVGDMFKALVQNDQAMCVVISIVLINTSIYLTSNLIIYFFKYDFGGVDWYNSYTLFTSYGFICQMLAMMVLYPILRNAFKMTTEKIFYTSFFMAIAGYAVLLLFTFVVMAKNVFVLFVPGTFIFAANGLFSILTTVFLANSVDYGELKNNRRDESVIFSMQTFVVKLASGLAIFIASMCLQVFALKQDSVDVAQDFAAAVPMSSKMGLRFTMALVPIVGLAIGFVWFKSKFRLTDKKMDEINEELKSKHEVAAK